jgi:flagellar biogenesis protein FliO
MTRAHYVGVLALSVMSLTSLMTSARSSPSTASRSWLRTETQRQTASGAVPSRNGLGKSVAALLLLGIVGYAIWHKTRKARVSTTPTRTHIRVVGGTLVGPKARAVVAEVGGRRILLGVTEQSVRRLAWLDAVDDVERDTESGRETSANATSASHTPVEGIRGANPHTNAPRRKESERSKFSEVLMDAVGFKARRVSEPALALAESTRDRVNLRATDDFSPNAPLLIDVEGQAAGLVSRLSRPKS